MPRGDGTGPGGQGPGTRRGMGQGQGQGKGWVDRLLEDQAEIAYARVVEQRSLMLSDSLAIKEAVLNVVRK